MSKIFSVATVLVGVLATAEHVQAYNTFRGDPELSMRKFSHTKYDEGLLPGQMKRRDRVVLDANQLTKDLSMLVTEQDSSSAGYSPQQNISQTAGLVANQKGKRGAIAGTLAPIKIDIYSQIEQQIEQKPVKPANTVKGLNSLLALIDVPQMASGKDKILESKMPQPSPKLRQAIAALSAAPVASEPKESKQSLASAEPQYSYDINSLKTRAKAFLQQANFAKPGVLLVRGSSKLSDDVAADMADLDEHAKHLDPRLNARVLEYRETRSQQTQLKAPKRKASVGLERSSLVIPAEEKKEIQQRITDLDMAHMDNSAGQHPLFKRRNIPQGSSKLQDAIEGLVALRDAPVASEPKESKQPAPSMIAPKYSYSIESLRVRAGGLGVLKLSESEELSEDIAADISRLDDYAKQLGPKLSLSVGVFNYRLLEYLARTSQQTKPDGTKVHKFPQPILATSREEKLAEVDNLLQEAETKRDMALLNLRAEGNLKKTHVLSPEELLKFNALFSHREYPITAELREVQKMFYYRHLEAATANLSLIPAN